MQVAYLRENVRMENGQVTLFTDSLNYERIPNIGYYFEGGRLRILDSAILFYGQDSRRRSWRCSMTACGLKTLTSHHFLILWIYDSTS
ncbi:MAG: OstA-like protein [Parabacteroides johnsonii]